MKGITKGTLGFMRKEKFMKTKKRIAKSMIAAVMFLVLLLTTLPGMM